MEIYIIPVSDSLSVSDKFIIYRPLINLAFVGNRAMVNLIEKLTHSAELEKISVLGQLPDVSNYLQSIGFWEEDPPAPWLRSSQFLPTTAVLLLTNRCQLHCIYCYALGGDKTARDLDTSLGYAVIDSVYRNAVEKGLEEYELTFHGGGEPTTNWDTFQKCTLYARQKPLKVKITLTTNGIWSLTQTRWIVDHLDSLSISMDGSPDTQNRSRPFRSGRSSSTRIMRSIHYLDEKVYPYGIRMTATSPWHHLPGDVKFICENTGCRSIQVEPSYLISRGGHGRPDAEAVDGFSMAFLEAYEIAVQYGRRFYYSGARLGVVSDTFCTAPYNALIVNADSEVVTCYEIADRQHALMSISIIGKINNGEVIINEEARNHLHQLMAERRLSCRSCFCYWSCAGDCYTRSFQECLNGHVIHSGRCEVNRIITKQLILRKIAESKDSLYRGSITTKPGFGEVSYSYG